jgi:hypothetical protein
MMTETRLIRCRFCNGVNCEHSDHCLDCGCPDCGYPGQARFGECIDCGWHRRGITGQQLKDIRRVVGNHAGTEEFRALMGLPADVVLPAIWGDPNED